MRYFKHMSDMRNDVKIRRLIRKYGAVGYAVYNYVLESIVYRIDADYPEPMLEENADDIAYFFGIEEQEVQKVLNTCVELQLLSVENGYIFCHKIYKYLEKSSVASAYLRDVIENYKENEKSKKVKAENGEIKAEDENIESNRIAQVTVDKIESETNEQLMKQTENHHETHENTQNIRETHDSSDSASEEIRNNQDKSDNSIRNIRDISDKGIRVIRDISDRELRVIRDIPEKDIDLDIDIDLDKDIDYSSFNSLKDTRNNKKLDFNYISGVENSTPPPTQQTDPFLGPVPVTNSEKLPTKNKDSPSKAKKEELKKPYDDLGLVKLTDDEYEYLSRRFTVDVLNDAIEALSAYKQAHGKRYKSDAGALRQWAIPKVLEKRLLERSRASPSGGYIDFEKKRQQEIQEVIEEYKRSKAQEASL